MTSALLPHLSLFQHACGIQPQDVCESGSTSDRWEGRGCLRSGVVGALCVCVGGWVCVVGGWGVKGCKFE